MSHPYDFSDLEYELERESDLDGAEELQPQSSEASEGDGDLAEKFYELSTRSFESGSEIDDQVEKLLGEVEREYFFGKLWKKLKKKGLKGLLRKAVELGTGVMPVMAALKGATQIARSVMRNKYLGPLAKAALSAVPGGGVALPALQALGYEHEASSDDQRQFWNNFVGFAREAYDDLADRVETADTVHESSDLADQSFQEVLGQYRGGKTLVAKRATRVIRITPGQQVLIKVG